MRQLSILVAGPGTFLRSRTYVSGHSPQYEPGVDLGLVLWFRLCKQLPEQLLVLRMVPQVRINGYLSLERAFGYCLAPWCCTPQWGTRVRRSPAPSGFPPVPRPFDPCYGTSRPFVQVSSSGCGCGRKSQFRLSGRLPPASKPPEGWPQLLAFSPMPGSSHSKVYRHRPAHRATREYVGQQETPREKVPGLTMPSSWFLSPASAQ